MPKRQGRGQAPRRRQPPVVFCRGSSSLRALKDKTVSAISRDDLPISYLHRICGRCHRRSLLQHGPLRHHRRLNTCCPFPGPSSSWHFHRHLVYHSTGDDFPRRTKRSHFSNQILSIWVTTQSSRFIQGLVTLHSGRIKQGSGTPHSGKFIQGWGIQHSGRITQV